MSKTRQRFMDRKKARRTARKREAWEAAHTFACHGLRQRFGKENQPCGFPVRFTRQKEGSHATCSYCNQLHTFGSPMTSTGLASHRWMTAETYAENVLPEESVETIELPEGREVRLVDHAAWCSDRSRPLYGARGEWQGAGKIVWRMGGRFWHTCLSSQAGRDIAYARWGNAR